MTMLMDYTDEGETRINEAVTDSLRFDITHVVYGSSGFNAGSPTTPLPLVPAATSLVSEVFRKEIPPENVTDDIIKAPYGRMSIYTTVAGTEFTSVLGEAGIIATVTDPGTTGLALGYEFLITQAHFPRIVFSLYQRLAVRWPLDLIVIPAMSFLGEGFLSINAQVMVGVLDAPVSYWSLDNADISGLSVLDGMGLNDGTNVNAVTGSAGQVNEAFDFDGAISRIVVPNDISLESHISVSGALSLSAWINPDDLLADYTVISKWDSTNGERAWKFEVLNTTGRVRLTVSDPSGTDSISVDSTNGVTAGSWNHVGFVFSAGAGALATDKIKTYVAGLPETGIAGPAAGSFANTSATQADVLIGANNPSVPAGHFNGLIDEMILFSAAISDTNQNDVFVVGNGGTRFVSAVPTPTSNWTFDNADYSAPTVFDIVGANDGTNKGLATTGVAGVVNEAFDFDGAADYVNYGDVLDQGTAGFTFGTWFRADGLGSIQRLLSKGLHSGGTPADAGWGVRLDASDQLTAEAHDGTTLFSANDSAAVASGAMYHVLMAIDRTNDELRLYKDGSLIGAPINISTLGNVDTNLDLASGALSRDSIAAAALEFFDGMLDEPFIMSGVELEASRAKAVANMGVPVIASPVAYWSFDTVDISGSTAADRSLRSNDGTITGATTGTGKINEALDFTAAGHVVSAGTGTDFDVAPKTALSCSAWINPRTLVPATSVIMNHADDIANGVGWDIHITTAGEVVMIVRHGTTDAVATTVPGDIVTGVYTHVIGYYDAATATIKIYINGILAPLGSSSAGAGAVASDALESMLIGNNTGATGAFDGLIDEPTIYSASVGAKQAAWIFSEGLKGRQVLP